MAHVQELLAREQQRFADEHPRSYALHQQAGQSLLAGVPMNWMTRWASPVPPFVAHGEGARVTDVDGHEYVDFALGDTGAMAGHAPPAAVTAIAEQAARGITFMLPTEDSNWAGEEMARRFRLPFWQFTLTATDANRFVIRLARQITGRPKIIVHNWCYHGSVDETLATTIDGVVESRDGTSDRQSTPRRRPASWSSTTSTPSSRRSPRVTSPAFWPSRR
jgi:glutamate-1-semialdehyde 2,1-aminomutase